MHLGLIASHAWSRPLYCLRPPRCPTHHRVTPLTAQPSPLRFLVSRFRRSYNPPLISSARICQQFLCRSRTRRNSIRISRKRLKGQGILKRSRSTRTVGELSVQIVPAQTDSATHGGGTESLSRS